GFGIRPDQAVEVARLELVGVGGQRLGVGHAEVTGAHREVVSERQRAQRGVPAGTAASDGELVPVDQALGRQMAGGVDAVVDVDAPPRPLQSLAVLAAVAGTAAVVDIDYGEASRRPV